MTPDIHCIDVPAIYTQICLVGTQVLWSTTGGCDVIVAKAGTGRFIWYVPEQHTELCPLKPGTQGTVELNK